MSSTLVARPTSSLSLSLSCCIPDICVTQLPHFSPPFLLPCSTTSESSATSFLIALKTFSGMPGSSLLFHPRRPSASTVDTHSSLHSEHLETQCEGACSSTSTRSKALAKSSTTVIAHWFFSHALQSHLSISSSVSQTVRYAPPLLPAAVSHPTRCLTFHLDTSSARNHSHQRINVEQKRDGTFAREVLRNLEEHSRARLLRPSPTLLNLRGLRSTLCTSESYCQCFAHSFLFSSPLFMGLAPSSNLSTPANHLPMQLASGLCATNLLLLPHWKSAGWTASDAPLLPSFLILVVLFMKRSKTLIAVSCPPILGGATFFFYNQLPARPRTHQLCSAFILDLPNHTCHV